MNDAAAYPDSALAPQEFVLYVAGNAPRSQRAIANLQRFCAEYLADRSTVEINDIYAEPQKAIADGVIAAPMLVRRSPAPVRRFVGDLNDWKALREELGING